EQCLRCFRRTGNRFVSAASFAASAEEANYTPGPYPRQRLLREKLKKLPPPVAQINQTIEVKENMPMGIFDIQQIIRAYHGLRHANAYAHLSDSATLACIWHATCLPWTLYICSNSMF
ncbi:hypothetical protein, partial [Chromobacterium alticapitis]|uniref:hypothetical protein n=1 Tax=Chromobacterium alticapitis TaxID=2073169 RepID=UPI001E52A480